MKVELEQSLTEFALLQIQQDIVQGQFSPDQHLNIERLKQRYSIGASPIREALNQLVPSGLVVAMRLKGFRVASISTEDLSDIFHARVVLERDMLGSALRLGDEAWEADVVAVLYRFKKQWQIGAMDDWSPLPWLERYAAYWQQLLSASSSRWLCQLQQTLFMQSQRYWFIALTMDSLSDLLVSHTHLYQTMVDSILARDVSAAIEVLHTLQQQDLFFLQRGLRELK